MGLKRRWLGRTAGYTRCNDRMWWMITALYPRTPNGNTVIDIKESNEDTLCHLLYSNPPSYSSASTAGLCSILNVCYGGGAGLCADSPLVQFFSSSVSVLMQLRRVNILRPSTPGAVLTHLVYMNRISNLQHSRHPSKLITEAEASSPRDSWKTTSSIEQPPLLQHYSVENSRHAISVLAKPLAAEFI